MFNCLWPRFFIIHSNSADRTRNLSTESELNCAVQKIKIKDKEKSEKSPASRQLTESKRSNYLSAFGSLSFCFLFFVCSVWSVLFYHSLPLDFFFALFCSNSTSQRLLTFANWSPRSLSTFFSLTLKRARVCRVSQPFSVSATFADFSSGFRSCLVLSICFISSTCHVRNVLIRVIANLDAWANFMVPWQWSRPSLEIWWRIITPN